MRITTLQDGIDVFERIYKTAVESIKKEPNLSPALITVRSDLYRPLLEYMAVIASADQESDIAPEDFLKAGERLTLYVDNYEIPIEKCNNQNFAIAIKFTPRNKKAAS